jgi:Na+-translocating ferredoxin:NAD+ oxidoreductase RnfG subunit
VKKILLYGVLGLIAAAALVLVGYIYFQNTEYKRKAMSEASKLAGTQVECAGFTFNPFTKTLSIRNLRIGNPSKYKTLYATQVGQVMVRFSEIDMEAGQFLIAGIRMEDAFVNFEVDGTIENNLRDVLNHMEKTPSGGIGKLRVQSLEMAPINISLNSVRYKREVGNLTAPGFTLTSLGGTESLNARELSERLLRALLLHAVATIHRDTESKADPLFRRSAGEQLTVLAEQYPDLARELKL